jgi:hypothetical protein
MRRLKAGVLLAGLLLLANAAAAKPACRAEGEPIQWIADYCMLTLGTDDEIAASACIEKESKRRFAGRCASNMHYKTKMCRIMAAAGTRQGSVEQCVKDPTFKGRTVENGGVGSN